MSAAASEVGLPASSIRILLVEGDDRPGLGLAIAQAMSAAGNDITFLLFRRWAKILGRARVRIGRRRQESDTNHQEGDGEQEELKGHEEAKINGPQVCVIASSFDWQSRIKREGRGKRHWAGLFRILLAQPHSSSSDHLLGNEQEQSAVVLIHTSEQSA